MKHFIEYFSNKDQKFIKRELDMFDEKNREFIAKSSGNTCKVYFDKDKQGYRTATNNWFISKEV
jgi:hypothetical protein